jgi:hypothetical protein
MSTKNSSEKSIKKIQNSKSIKFNPMESTKNKFNINIYKSEKIVHNTTNSIKQLANFNSIKMNKVKSPPRNNTIQNGKGSKNKHHNENSKKSN